MGRLTKRRTSCAAKRLRKTPAHQASDRPRPLTGRCGALCEGRSSLSHHRGLRGHRRARPTRVGNTWPPQSPVERVHVPAAPARSRLALAIRRAFCSALASQENPSGRLLSRPDGGPWSLTVLRATLDHVAPSDFSDARLEQHGVIVTESDGILASPCAQRIEALGLIGQ